jgi:hypothetical protein
VLVNRPIDERRSVMALPDGQKMEAESDLSYAFGICICFVISLFILKQCIWEIESADYDAAAGLAGAVAGLLLFSAKLALKSRFTKSDLFGLLGGLIFSAGALLLFFGPAATGIFVPAIAILSLGFYMWCRTMFSDGISKHDQIDRTIVRPRTRPIGVFVLILMGTLVFLSVQIEHPAGKIRRLANFAKIGLGPTIYRNYTEMLNNPPRVGDEIAFSAAITNGYRQSEIAIGGVGAEPDGKYINDDFDYKIDLENLKNETTTLAGNMDMAVQEKPDNTTYEELCRGIDTIEACRTLLQTEKSTFLSPDSMRVFYDKAMNQIYHGTNEEISLWLINRTDSIISDKSLRFSFKKPAYGSDSSNKEKYLFSRLILYRESPPGKAPENEKYVISVFDEIYSQLKESSLSEPFEAHGFVYKIDDERLVLSREGQGSGTVIKEAVSFIILLLLIIAGICCISLRSRRARA